MISFKSSNIRVFVIQSWEEESIIYPSTVLRFEYGSFTNLQNKFIFKISSYWTYVKSNLSSVLFHWSNTRYTRGFVFTHFTLLFFQIKNFHYFCFLFVFLYWKELNTTSFNSTPCLMVHLPVPFPSTTVTFVSLLFSFSLYTSYRTLSTDRTRVLSFVKPYRSRMSPYHKSRPTLDWYLLRIWSRRVWIHVHSWAPKQF